MIVSFDTSDDASVYKLNDSIATVQTVDIFPPLVNDPFVYGQIAAANALSDVYAMGGKPTVCLNILCCPEDLDSDILVQILKGGYEKVNEAGAVVSGGHTIKDNELKYGLSVSGIIDPNKVITNSNAKPGDIIIYTKLLGTGILATALRADLITDQTYNALISNMVTLNSQAAHIMSDFAVNSCTDITGFGFLGHICEMAVGSKCTITVDSSKLAVLPQAVEMAEMGIIPAGAYRNREHFDPYIHMESQVPLPIQDIMFDPQTSGGLLISLPKEEGLLLSDKLKQSDIPSQVLGEVDELKEHYVYVK